MEQDTVISDAERISKNVVAEVQLNIEAPLKPKTSTTVFQTGSS